MMFIPTKNIGFLIVILISLSFISSAFGQNIFTFTPPTGDQWQYSLNPTPGTRATGTAFWNDKTLSSDFNHRDGAIILMWDTSAIIPSGHPLVDYDVVGCKISIWNIKDATWTLIGNNNNLVPKRVELFGVGFTAVDPVTWTETNGFVGGSSSTPGAPRDPYPIDLATSGHAEDAIAAVPWAEGSPVAYTPGAQTEPFEIEFLPDTSNPTIKTYLQQSLSNGRVYFMITSTHDSTTPLSTPELILKEGVVANPNSAAPLLEVTLGDISTPIRQWNQY